MKWVIRILIKMLGKLIREDSNEVVSPQKPTRQELEKWIQAWQTWWTNHGSQWYSKCFYNISYRPDGKAVTHTIPQNERPPHLQQGNPLHGAWIDENGNRVKDGK